MTDLNKYKDPNNVYKQLWDKHEDLDNPPIFYRNIIEIDFTEFKEKVYSNDKNFANKLVTNLLKGDVFLLKKTFPDSFCDWLLKEWFTTHIIDFDKT